MDATALFYDTREALILPIIRPVGHKSRIVAACLEQLGRAIGAARAGSVQIQDNRPLSLRGVAVRIERVMEFPHKKTDLLLCQT